MSEIVKITCGKLPCVMPDGSTAAADYSELTVTKNGAELVRYQGGDRDIAPIEEEVFLQTVLEETAALIAAHSDTSQPELPIASQVTYRDGTVKYAPQEALSRILHNLSLLLTLKDTELVRTQGLVAAPPSAMPLQGMTLFQMMQNRPQTAAPPMLQGLVAAAPPPAVKQTEWHCVCGAVSTGKFCAECGSPKP